MDEQKWEVDEAGNGICPECGETLQWLPDNRLASVLQCPKCGYVAHYEKKNGGCGDVIGRFLMVIVWLILIGIALGLLMMVGTNHPK